jgi:hypothetical protein
MEKIHMNSGRFFVVVLVTLWLVLPITAADTSDPVASAGALYSKSVDLAESGKYSEALEAADEALALNVTSYVPLIQANRPIGDANGLKRQMRQQMRACL